jgi:hypothetical protein
MVPSVRADRKWYSLALRHLRMARRLLRSGFADGAAFHGYHCYECLLSALIAAKGYPVPPEGWTRLELPSGRVIEAHPSPSGSIQERNAHKARIVFFDELADLGRRYLALHRLLRTFLTYQDRLRGWSLRVGPSCRFGCRGDARVARSAAGRQHAAEGMGVALRATGDAGVAPTNRHPAPGFHDRPLRCPVLRPWNGPTPAGSVFGGVRRRIAVHALAVCTGSAVRDSVSECGNCWRRSGSSYFRSAAPMIRHALIPPNPNEFFTR